MTGSEREWKTLAAAVGQISGGLCLWCPTSAFRLRWSETGQRWQLVIVHRPRCRATRSIMHRKRADEFVHGLLLLHGAPVAHYGEEHLVRHTRVVVLW